MTDTEAELERTRRSWNAAVPAHASHRPGLARFLAQGGSTLFPEERALLGPVEGRRVVHLLCNSGQDTISLAAAGARATGVDLSDAAIATARRLAGETGIAADFVRAEVMGWLHAEGRAGPRHDLAFASYGVVCWLRDVPAFAAALAGVVRPGGRFVLVDFHPLASTLDGDWRLRSPYPSGGAPLALEGVGDYVGAARGGLSPGGFTDGVAGFHNPHPCTLYRWGLGEVVTAFCGRGWSVERLEEYPFANGERQFAGMRVLPGRRMVPPDTVPPLPLMYGLVAQRSWQ